MGEGENPWTSGQDAAEVLGGRRAVDSFREQGEGGEAEGQAQVTGELIHAQAADEFLHPRAAGELLTRGRPTSSSRAGLASSSIRGRAESSEAVGLSHVASFRRAL